MKSFIPSTTSANTCSKVYFIWQTLISRCSCFKRTFLISVLILIFFPGFSQLSVPGVAIRDYRKLFKEGDTVRVYAIHDIGGVVSGYSLKDGKDFKIIPKKYLEVSLDALPFWDKAWMLHSGSVGLDNEKDRNLVLKADTITGFLIRDFEKNEQLVRDELLYEYLYKLIHQLHPGSIHKGEEYSIRPVVVTTAEKPIISFGNGMIFMTTDFLTTLKDDKELMRKLSAEIAKILLNEQEVMYEKEMNSLSSVYYLKFEKQFISSRPDSLNAEFLNALSSVLIRSAWTKYTAMNYNSALKDLLKLDSADVLSANETVLKSKLYRKLYFSPAKNHEALIFIDKAIDDSNGNMIDLFFEKSLFQIRLGDYENARISLGKYAEGLKKMEEAGISTSAEKMELNSVLLELKRLNQNHPQ